MYVVRSSNDCCYFIQIEELRLCDEIAKSRTGNWQAFCVENAGKLSYKNLFCSVILKTWLEIILYVIW